jgi:hypothetical protein
LFRKEYMTALMYPPSINGTQKTLGANLLSGVTAAVTLNNVVGIQNKPGVLVVDRVDTNGVETPTKREYISFTGTSGSTLVTLVRNVDGGGTDQDHAIGAIVEFVPDVVLQQSVNDVITAQHSVAGVHSDALVTTLKATSAEVTTGTEDAKIATPKAIKDAGIVVTPVKASSAEVTTGTDDAKFTTPKALKDAGISASSAGVGSDGWTATSDAWTYASASTINVPSGAASLYNKGDRVKFTQTTVKYFVVVAVADTLLTVAVNTDYTVANAAISAISYSHQASPVGFPDWFAFTPTYSSGGGAFTNNPTKTESSYSITGNKITVRGVLTYHATSGGSGDTYVQALPVTSTGSCVGSVRRTSDGIYGGLYITNGINYLLIAKNDSTTIISNSAGIQYSITFGY